MKNYRRSDQEYADQYDSYTIKRLKEIEKETKIPLSTTFDFIESYNSFSPFYEFAAHRAQQREESIRGMQRADERRDSIITRTPIPKNVRCKQCFSEMYLDTHFFKDNDNLLLFVFACPEKHIPKTVLYPDGKREWIFPKDTCKKCGSDEIISKTEKKKKLLIFTDTCADCGDVLSTKLELPKPEPPISEVDRKKYCIDWKDRRTLMQDLATLSDIMVSIEKHNKEKEIKDEYKVDDIEKVNVPKLEDRLLKLSEEFGYIKFKFDTHSTEKYLTISFSVQDPTDRNEKASKKVLTKEIQKALMKTNWRLIPAGIDYRFGLLTGKLRAYADDDGLLKIAKEIHNNKK